MRLAPEEQASLGRGPELSPSVPNFLLSPGSGSLAPAASQWKISLALGLKAWPEAGPGPDSRSLVPRPVSQAEEEHSLADPGLAWPGYQSSQLPIMQGVTIKHTLTPFVLSSSRPSPSNTVPTKSQKEGFEQGLKLY